jgi:hypothetical protein
MGFNLGLRDVASLAELIAEHRQRGFDAGHAALCWPSTMPGARPIGAASSPSPMGWCALFRQSAGAVRACATSAAGLRSAAAGQGRAVALSTGGGGPRSEARARGALHERADAAVSRDFDVIIVGAGVIGAVMASLLVRAAVARLRGWRSSRIVLRAALPARPIGTCGCSR